MHEVDDVSMRTMQEIENERYWTVFAALCLLMAMLLGAVAFGYFALYMWAFERADGSMELLAHAFAVISTLFCMAPGLVVWRRLRGRTRYAALYGLALAAAVSICVPLLMGAPLGASPEGQLLENIVF